MASREEALSKLTGEEKELLKKSGIFDDRPDALCDDCGGYHIRGVPRKENPYLMMRTCPRVKRKTWHPNGNLTEVEYWKHGEWDESSVIYAEDLYEEDG